MTVVTIYHMIHVQTAFRLNAEVLQGLIYTKFLCIENQSKSIMYINILFVATYYHYMQIQVVSVICNPTLCDFTFTQLEKNEKGPEKMLYLS